MRKSIYALPLLLWACQPQPTSSPALSASPTAQSLSLNSTVAPPMRRNYPALTKYPSQGQLHFEGHQLQLRLELYPAVDQAPDFRTQLLDLNSASHLYATVTDSHGKSYAPNGADGNGAVSYSGGTITLTFEDIVPDELLLVEVQAKDGSTDIVQADLATVLKHTAAVSNPGGTINFQTTVAAKAMKALLASDAGRARAIDLSALETLATSITGVSGTAPNLSYANNHPSLVNTAQLATDLQGQDPGDLTAGDYRQSGATVNLTVSGLQNTDTLQVQITDAASAVLTDLDNGSHSIAGVTPGAGLEVRATSFGTPVITYNYTVTPSTINPGEGGSIPVTIAAAPALEISGFSPAAGAPGTSVTINGNGFTGTTAVTIGGASATFSVVSDTQITATVPVTAVDGIINVTNGNTANSVTAFDVYRRIYVNDDAGGSNNGTSWANAYNSLQSALAASGANDEIWIAAGTYTPHASNRDVAFQMKANVNIYGGFAGTETALGERTASLTDFVTVLSGDLNGNDNYTTPGSTLDENSFHVTEGANNAILDGVTVQGGKANGVAPNDKGGGIYNSVDSPTLNNVVFTNNSSSDDGGGIYNYHSSPTLNNVTISHNATENYGGGMYSFGASSPTLTHVVFSNNTTNFRGGGFYGNVSVSAILTDVTFSNNSAADDGGGMYCSISAPTLNQVSFINNSAGNNGGGFWNYGASPILNNVAFTNNSAQGNGGGMLHLDTSAAPPSLNNVTFANNSALGNGGGMSYSSGVSANLKNVLFWNSTRSNISLDTPNGVIEASSDPFVDSGNPNGVDGIPRTADDGLRIDAGAADVLNQGISGAGIPTADILGNARVGNPEPGAYEYLP